MKRLYSILLVFTMAITSMLVTCAADSGMVENIVFLTDDEASIIDGEAYAAFLDNDGIIVVTHDTENPIALEEQLGIPFSLEEISNESEVDAGVDIATLYYEYGEGLKGTYIINIGNEDIVDEDALIDEAVMSIRERQTEQNGQTNEVATVASNGYSDISLGTLTVSTVRKPKGKLVGTFEIFTVQEYNDRDYYIVKSTVTGYPGCCLADSDDAYGSSYQGEGMEVCYSTPSSSTTVDTYGPAGTINSGSYSVDLGVSFTPEEILSFNWGLSYTREFLDTTISCTGSTTERTWDVTIRSSAQEQIAMFEPGVTFVCPSTKGYIDIGIYGAYDIDSWITAVETISFDRTMRCSSADAELLN